MIQDSVHRRYLVYSTTIVDLPRVNKLLAPTDGQDLRVGLVSQSLEASLDRVQGIA